MEGNAEPTRNLARTQEQFGSLSARHTKFSFEPYKAVNVGAGNAQEEIDVPGSPRLSDDLIELFIAVEGEAAHPEIVIRAHD